MAADALYFCGHRESLCARVSGVRVWKIRERNRIDKVTNKIYFSSSVDCHKSLTVYSVENVLYTFKERKDDDAGAGFSHFSDTFLSKFIASVSGKCVRSKGRNNYTHEASKGCKTVLYFMATVTAITNKQTYRQVGLLGIHITVFVVPFNGSSVQT